MARKFNGNKILQFVYIVQIEKLTDFNFMKVLVITMIVASYIDLAFHIHQFIDFNFKVLPLTVN